MAGIGSLRDIPLLTEYRSDSNDIIRDFYEPCLSAATAYDRAVGYFSSHGLLAAASGLKVFTERTGSMRLIASPILMPDDIEAIDRGLRARADVIEQRLLERAIELAGAPSASWLAWLVAEHRLDIRLAVPTNPNGSLRRGIYHEKIGIFADAHGNSVAFTGSPNETDGGLVHNFESFDVYWSWQDDLNRIARKRENFNRLWENRTNGLSVETVPESVRKKLIQLHQSGPQRRITETPRPATDVNDSLWPHQVKARDVFLEKHHGVLAMATGTGKTRTALAICEHLLGRNQIGTIIVAADGNDLLKQWSCDLIELCRRQPRTFRMYSDYDTMHQTNEFLEDLSGAVLLCSRANLHKALRRITPDDKRNTLLIHDEVHRLGSEGNRDQLARLHDGIAFRLGLSATPEREYDETGNVFIEEATGPEIYNYGLAEAISDGILAPFNYIALSYMPSDDDKQRARDVYKQEAARRHSGNPMPKAELYTAIARVYKTSLEKIPVFSAFVQSSPAILRRCIVFVEEREYGDAVIDHIHAYQKYFHTYYSGEDKEVLRRFAMGDLECLVTCHRLSEGIDIRTLSNVVLFSSARARLEITQRIGRCLRFDPANPDKIANVIDFVRNDEPPLPTDTKASTDTLRKEWLTALSQIRRTN